MGASSKEVTWDRRRGDRRAEALRHRPPPMRTRRREATRHIWRRKLERSSKPLRRPPPRDRAPRRARSVRARSGDHRRRDGSMDCQRLSRSPRDGTRSCAPARGIRGANRGDGMIRPPWALRGRRVARSPDGDRRSRRERDRAGARQPRDWSTPATAIEAVLAEPSKVRGSIWRPDSEGMEEHGSQGSWKQHAGATPPRVRRTAGRGGRLSSGRFWTRACRPSSRQPRSRRARSRSRLNGAWVACGRR